MRRLSVEELWNTMERVSRVSAANSGRGVESSVDLLGLELATFRAGDKLSLVDLSRAMDDFYYDVALWCDLAVSHGRLDGQQYSELLQKTRSVLGQFRQEVAGRGPGSSMSESDRMGFMSGVDGLPSEILQSIELMQAVGEIESVVAGDTQNLRAQVGDDFSSAAIPDARASQDVR